MSKVQKTSHYEMQVQFDEFFDTATLAANQKMPSEAAKIKISDIKLIKANTKNVVEESINSNVEQQ
tara:strand:+ start:728 stop:925 length:198 start_codon:yes stop_codon:yes gene_type:complete